MTVAGFRKIALSMPEAAEGSHMDHPDFRVKGRIFATLWPDGEWGMVKLKPDQQRRLVAENPGVFQPVKGGWGRNGATQVNLKEVDRATLKAAMTVAWRNSAPPRLVDQFEKPPAPRRRNTAR